MTLYLIWHSRKQPTQLDKRNKLTEILERETIV